MTYKPEGNLSSKLAFIGEAPARNELLEGRPFAGRAGSIYDECLHFAGIIRRDVYTTNLFDCEVSKPPGKETLIRVTDGTTLYTGAKFTTEGLTYVKRLREELEQSEANVLVPMGNPAMNALTGRKGITKWRGSILPSNLLAGRKCIPTIHPAATLPNRGKYIWRYLVKNDFRRAREQSAFPEIQPLPYRFFHDPDFVTTIKYLNDILRINKPTAIDLEVVNQQPSRISLSNKPFYAITIPFDDRWTLEEEDAIWMHIYRILNNPDILKIFQNGMFDIVFLIMTMHIFTAPPYADTMVGQHLMYPDFKKDLGFITTAHTLQPYYKGMVRHDEGEKKDG